MRYTTSIIFNALEHHNAKLTSEGGMLRATTHRLSCRCGEKFVGRDLDRIRAEHLEHVADCVREDLLRAEATAVAPPRRPFMTVQHLTSH